MDIEDITLESLLQNDNIRSLNIAGMLYFSKDDLNKYFDDNFIHIDSVEMSDMSPGNLLQPIQYITAKNILEHVEYRKSMPSFKSAINKIFKKGV